MKKLMILTVMVGLLLGGCISKTKLYSATPGIKKIDRVMIKGNPNNDIVLGPTRIKGHQYSNKRKKRLEQLETRRSIRLTQAYKHHSLEDVKSEFRAIKSPCFEMQEDLLSCVYPLISYRNYSPAMYKVVLNFQINRNLLLVHYEADGCLYRSDDDICDTTPNYRMHRKVLVKEVLGYFEEYYPEKLLEEE